MVLEPSIQQMNRASQIGIKSWHIGVYVNGVAISLAEVTNTYKKH